ncbi:extracellular solute-binding protein [Paenibacillus alginolyticus]|uniref:Extracellular solute-binding protein n=1 Tax=Paenibacillus alginolyticus TaxID=59839 RepID=A0ABT4G8I3_9BACL|nr:extracellular solute-binding protein [Paenibacillus alginolyticus]MCY9668105.1 extracellular solute-binding protein [Paenibacillus alginolyticus]MCY9692472.1 extracellular solute-binding protein [Paenibacillus alginolyticus]MEC0144264.1 extracellular solute-binding protein [Paenibacillus alginolyticus]
MNSKLSAKKKWMAAAVLTSLSLAAMIGCSSGKQTAAGGNKGDAVAQEPMNISIMLPNFKPAFPKDDGPVAKEIEKLTNTDIHFEWVPNNTYPDKFNITLASGKLPMVMVVQEKNASFINAARSGAFWEVGPYMKDYPNLSKANPIVNNNISIDGKIYGIYRSRPLGRNGIVYRKDWLENVGLQPPKTIDDFYNMLKAFKEKDPDKNGKNDTYGMVISKFTGPFDIMQIWFGAPNKWGQDATGKLVPAHETPEYMDALRFFKKLYDEKLINADFAVMDTAKYNDPIINNQAGAMVDVTDNAARLDDKIHQALQKAGKDAPNKQFMDIIGAVSGPKGLHNLPTSGYAGMVSISKTGVKTEQELRRVLAFLDKMNEQELSTLAERGIEGKHYTKLEGGFIETSKDSNLMEGEVEGFNQFVAFIPETRTLPVKTTPVRKKSDEVQKSNEPIIVANPAEPLVSNVYTQKGAQLDTMISDARTKYIVGQIDEAGFKAAVELWKKSGGDDYVKEINDLYKAIKK